MKIMSLNIKDFGGVTEKLMGQKTVGYKGKEVIDWKYWKDCIGTCRRYDLQINMRLLSYKYFCRIQAGLDCHLGQQ